MSKAKQRAVKIASAIAGGEFGRRAGKGMANLIAKIAIPDNIVKVGERKLGPDNINEGQWVDVLHNTAQHAQNVATGHLSPTAQVAGAVFGAVSAGLIARKLTSDRPTAEEDPKMGPQFKSRKK